MVQIGNAQVSHLTLLYEPVEQTTQPLLNEQRGRIIGLIAARSAQLMSDPDEEPDVRSFVFEFYMNAIDYLGERGLNFSHERDEPEFSREYWSMKEGPDVLLDHSATITKMGGKYYVSDFSSLLKPAQEPTPTPAAEERPSTVPEGIKKAVLKIAYDNGMIHRDFSEQKYLRAVEKFLAESSFKAHDLMIWNRWLLTLTEEDLEIYSAGEDTDMARIIAKEPKPEMSSGTFNQLLNQIFEMALGN